MVLPQRIFVKVDPKCDFIKAYRRPLGVLRVKLVKGSDFPDIISGGLIKMKDVPDMYCTFEFGNKEWTSSVQKDRRNPEWNETVDFVLSDYGQILDVRALDKDLIRTDNDMGCLQCTAVELLKDGGKREYTLAAPLSEDKKAKTKPSSFGRLTLECQMLTFCDDIASIAPNGSTGKPNTIKGMLIVFVSKITNLPVPKEEAASFVKITVGDKEFKTSTVAYDTEAAALAEEAAEEEALKAMEDSVLNPEFNAAFQIRINGDSEPHAEGITFELMNGTKSLGTSSISQELFMVMKNEVHQSRANIGGALMHCGVQALGLNSA